jgi:DNA invertase Pin-like site-specific DNA recombinase
MKKSVGYLRCSTNLQDQSITDQKAAILKYASEQEYEISDWFIDEGISGTSIEKRDAFQGMIKIIENGNREFDFILVYDISRWGRFPNSDESGYWEFHCQRYGVEVIYTNEPGLTENRLANTLIKNLKRSTAGDYSRNLSKLTTRGSKSNAEKGFWNGGPAPYGYKRGEYDKEGNFLNVLEFGELRRKGNKVKLVLGDSYDVNIIREIFDLYINEGYGLKNIANYLNKQGVPSPAKGKVINVKDESGNYIKKVNPGLWGASIIHRILNDRIYIGAIVYGLRKSGKFSREENTWEDKTGMKYYHDRSHQIIVENSHEPIIDLEKFDKAQLIMKQRFTFKKGVGGRTYDSGYMLSGIFFCEHCGFKYTGWTCTYNGKKYYYYKDSAKNTKGLSACEWSGKGKKKNIPRELVDDFAIKKIKKRLNSVSWKNRIEKRVVNKLENQYKSEDPQDYATDLIQLEQEINNLLDTVAVTGLTDTLKSKLTDRQNKLERLKQLKLNHSKQEKYENSKDTLIQNYLDIFSNIDKIFDEATNEEKKRLIKHFIRKVSLNKEKQQVTYQFYKIPVFENHAIIPQRSSCCEVQRIIFGKNRGVIGKYSGTSTKIPDSPK